MTLNDENSKSLQFLRSQNATLKKGRGQHKKYLPYVFTEHGAAMLSSVLKSKQAIQASIAIIRTFIKLRDFALSYEALAEKITELERYYKSHDKKITEIFAALRLLAENNEDNKSKKEIGFKYK